MPKPAQRSNERSSAASLRGKVAVVTGGSRGIGLAIAQALREAGCRLAVTAQFRDSKPGTTANKFGSESLVHSCDVRDETSVANFFAAVRKRFGRVDVLVNNAGIAGPTRNVGELSLADWRDVLETNLTGMFLTTRSALPLMSGGGVIINNLSISAKGNFPGMSAYNASKHGAAGFTATLREELREKGIRVVGLYPGATDTAIWKQFWPDAPRARMMSPATIAQAVVYAASTPPESTVEELVIAPSGGEL